MEPRARVEFDTRLSLPNHALIVGASQSGKTHLVLQLISNPQLFNPPPSRILFHYDQLQDTYLETKALLAKQGIELLLIKGCNNVSLDNLSKQPGQTLLILDDFSEHTSSSDEIAKIATNGRHLNISLWCIWHSLYCKYPASRVISQNVRWFFFLPSLRLESQLRTFGQQLGMKSRLLYAYDKIQCGRNYLLVDAGPNTPKLLRLRSHIHDSVQYCYE
jgi:hypothetical protein